MLDSRVKAKLAKLAEYETAEKEGRWLKTPCKIGDSLYCLNFRDKADATVYTATVIGFEYTGSFRKTVEFRFKKPISSYEQIHNHYGGSCSFGEIGKDYYFFTREEAERAAQARASQ
jgi:hypothetical protein